MTTVRTRSGVDREPSTPGRRRLPAVAATMLAVAAGICAASVLVGSSGLLPLAAITDSGHSSYPIFEARFERTVLALVVGAALGLVGACMQGLTRNPLADPGILGVNAGAAFAMVLAISYFGVSSLSGYLWFAFIGAAIAAVLVHMVAALGRDGATPMKIAIAGAALTAAVTSWTSGVLLIDRSTTASFRMWQVGTVGGRGFDTLVIGLPFIVVGAVMALFAARLLNTLALGDDLARGLGRRTGVDRTVLGIAIVLLAGTATALAGPIAFVGLIVPHAVRALVGPDYTKVLPMSAFGGAILLVAADTVGRVVLPPTEVQVGIMTALIGVPFFLHLIRRGRMAGL